MGDKRIPDITFLLRYKGRVKSHKIELFHQSQFAKGSKTRWTPQFRVRVNGRWFPYGSKDVFLYKYQIRDALWRNINWQLQV